MIGSLSGDMSWNRATIDVVSVTRSLSMDCERDAATRPSRSSSAQSRRMGKVSPLPIRPVTATSRPPGRAARMSLSTCLLRGVS